MKVVVFQWAVRDGGPAALAAPGAASQPRHLCRGACLVDEDQLFGVEVELAVEPGLAGLEDILALLAPPRGRSFF